MITGFMKGIIKTSLFLGSMLFFFAGIQGMCGFSTNNHVNQLRGNDATFLPAAWLVILTGSVLFYLWRRMCGGGSKHLMAILTLAIGIPCTMINHYNKAENLTLDLEDITDPPVVAGYDCGEGYVEQFPSLNVYKVNALLDTIDNPKRRAQIEYIFDTSYFSITCYENSEDLYTCNANELSNGNSISYRFVFDEEMAKENHISFDHVFQRYEVTGLVERPMVDWAVDETTLKSIVLAYVRSQGGQANTALVTDSFFDGREVVIQVKNVEGEGEEFLGYYKIDRITMQGENCMTGSLIDFNEYY